MLLTRSQESEFPQEVTAELRSERPLACFHSFVHSGGENDKAEAEVIPAEKGCLGRARWGGRSSVWCVDFAVPRSQRQPGPVQFPEEDKMGRSHSASDSPPPSRESTPR